MKFQKVEITYRDYQEDIADRDPDDQRITNDHQLKVIENDHRARMSKIIDFY